MQRRDDHHSAPRKVGQPFNPWRGACGFYPPDAVSRLGPVVVLGTRRKLSHAHKGFYKRLVRRWGREGPCFPSYESLAEDEGVSLRSAKMLVEDLEAFGLIGHTVRRGREKGGRHMKNEYFFLWHPIFEVQNPSVLKCKQSGFEVQDPEGLKCKNQQPLYSEETHTSETGPASEPAGPHFAEELKRLVNGYQHPAGRWIDGCSRARLSDGPLLDAIAESAGGRGLCAGDVAKLWARKALRIAKRSARADDPDAYFLVAFLNEMAGVTPAKTGPVAANTDGVLSDSTKKAPAPIPEFREEGSPSEAAIATCPLEPEQTYQENRTPISCRVEDVHQAELSVQDRKLLAEARRIYPFASRENLMEALPEMRAAKLRNDEESAKRCAVNLRLPNARNGSPSALKLPGGMPAAGDIPSARRESAESIEPRPPSRELISSREIYAASGGAR
jgi:Helix-turn-helix domain